jgi:polyhydroxybutyrate depolymerase
LILLGLCGLISILLAVVSARLNVTNGRIESSGQKRTYLLYVPESYDAATPAPLVVSLHGLLEWPAHQMQISHWNKLADRYGFIVVYPSGTGFPRHWQAFAQAGSPDTPMTDVVFISDLIDALEREYNIDETRIYANGLSNGGGMSYLLACKLADRITAIGSVSGAYAYPAAECKPSRPVPVIAFHGTSDRIVPYSGSPSTLFHWSLPAIPDWVQQWARRNGCDDQPVELPSSGEARGTRYTHCDRDADVVFYTIEGGGHAWPGGEAMPEIIVGHTTQDIDATELMWEFFTHYSMDRD